MNGMRGTRKNWNFTLAQSLALNVSIRQTISGWSSAALVMPDGRALCSKPSTPADLATLPFAASLCQQYLKLSHGELALVNDPSVSGTTLSEFTIVTGISFDGRGPADLLLAVREGFPTRFSDTGKLDQEGVRVPPTPIGSLTDYPKKINSDLLNAIGAHPFAPRDFVTRIMNSLERLDKTARGVRGLASDPSGELNRTSLKRYFADSSSVFEAAMSKWPLGSTIVTTTLEPGGETLKLRLEITEKHAQFDFGGTDASNSIALTEVATLGACVSTLLAALSPDAPLNSAVFDHFHVSAPTGTLVSTRTPNAGVVRGTTQGVAAVCNLVRLALSKLDANFKSAATAGCEGLFHIGFDDGSTFAGSVAPGIGATKEREGLDACALWGHRGVKRSIEEMESHSKVKVTAAGLRANSMGKGTKKGGMGEMITFKVEAAGDLQWFWGPQAHRQEGQESGRAGPPSEIELVNAKGDREELKASHGRHKLQSGDEVCMYASGGGGWGEPPEASN